MSAQNGTASIAKEVAEPIAEGKGKGKAAAEDVSMEGEDSSSEEELEEVCYTL